MLGKNGNLLAIDQESMMDEAAFQTSTRLIFSGFHIWSGVVMQQNWVFLLTIAGLITINFLCISLIWVHYFYAVIVSRADWNS